MGAKTLRLSLLMLFLSIGMSFAQTNDALEKEREKYIQKQLEEYNKRVDTYIGLLELDDFKGSIIKQKIDDFYKRRNEVVMSQIPEYEKEPMIEELKITHFSDVKELYTDETMMSVHRFLADNKAEVKKLQKDKKSKKNN